MKTKLKQGQTRWLVCHNRAGAYSNLPDECWTVHRVYITQIRGPSVHYTVDGNYPYIAGSAWLLKVTASKFNKAMRHAQDCADGRAVLWADQTRREIITGVPEAVKALDVDTPGASITTDAGAFPMVVEYPGDGDE